MNAPDNQTTALIAALPKVELHLHLEGSISAATLLTLAQRNKVAIPADTVAGIEQLFAYDDFSRFIRTFQTLVKVLCRGEDFALAAHELGLALGAQRVRYAEVMISPSQYFNRGMDLDEVVQGTMAGFAQAQAAGGPLVRLVFDYGRQFSIDDAWRVLDIAVRNQRHGVVGWSIGGDELRFPPEPFAPVFAAARAAGLHTMAHAGEVRGPASVWGAIDALGCTRIGHGITAVQDPALLAHLHAKGVTLDISPTSNLRTGACVLGATHPVRQLFDAGVLITINSDDPVLFGTTLSDEYALLVAQHGFTAAELAQLTRNALAAAFLESTAHAALVAQVEAELQGLGL